MEMKIVLDLLKKYSGVVVWGLFSHTTSTQRHVHRHIHDTVKKIGYPVFWCDNLPENNSLIPDGSLVLSSVECCDKIQHKRSDWYVQFHTVAPISACQNFLHLRVYGDSDIGKETVHWNSTTMFNKTAHLLSQSYGTDLLPEKFFPPVFSNSKVVNWIGSIWQDKNGHGNIENIEKLKKAISRHGLEFRSFSNISDSENSQRVRESRIAPAIGGKFQTVSMMPCRIWKNISYGQLGATNLDKAVEVFGSNLIYDSNIDVLIDKVVSIGEKEYKEMTLAQQEIVAREHTYLDWIYNVLRALEELGSL